MDRWIEPSLFPETVYSTDGCIIQSVSIRSTGRRGVFDDFAAAVFEDRAFGRESLFMGPAVGVPDEDDITQSQRGAVGSVSGIGIMDVGCGDAELPCKIGH